VECDVWHAIGFVLSHVAKVIEVLFGPLLQVRRKSYKAITEIAAARDHLFFRTIWSVFFSIFALSFSSILQKSEMSTRLLTSGCT
jgi:hypothetical protein